MLKLPTPTPPEANTNPLPQSSAPFIRPLAGHPTPLLPIPSSHGKKRIILIGGSAAVGIAALIGLGYAAWTGYLPTPLTKRPTTQDVLSALEHITSAQTTLNTQLSIEPRASDVEPLDFSLFTNETNNGENPFLKGMQIIPNDLALQLAVTSSIHTEGDTANQETHVTGTYQGNNITANIDVTARTVDGITYVKPDAIPLPIPFFDLNLLKGKWIDFANKTEARNVFTYNYENLKAPLTTPEKDSTVNTQTAFLNLLKQSIEDGAVIFSVPKRITSEKGERLWQTNGVIDGEKLRETVLATKTMDNAFLIATAKERAKDIYREIGSRTTITATFTDNGTPVTFTLSTRIAPKLEGNTFKDRQIAFKTSLHFENINQPITFTAPENILTGEDAIALLTGTNTEHLLEQKQRTTIGDLQDALEIYRKQQQSYPATLEDLLGAQNNLKKVTDIPPDIITKEPYLYAPTENGYTLSYEMPNEDLATGGEGVVQGTNTATELFFSEEAAKRTDADKDGLFAYDEMVTYGTSDSRADSDADGYEDKVEIDAGYNPHGEGLLIL